MHASLLAALALAAPAPTTVTIALDGALTHDLNAAGFIVSGTYPATLSRANALRLPVTGGSLAAGDALSTGGALFLHAGMHRVTLDRFALRARTGGGELRARVGNPTRRSVVTLATLPALARGRATLTRGGARALRSLLRTRTPRAEAALGRLTLR